MDDSPNFQAFIVSVGTFGLRTGSRILPPKTADGKGKLESLDLSATVFEQLMSVIEDRKANPPERSYTTKLFQGGVDAIGAKIIEEAIEVVEAATEGDSAEARDHLVHEAADLIYHLFVMLGHRDISLSAVEEKLAVRFGMSGLDEKAARGNVQGSDSEATGSDKS